MDVKDMGRKLVSLRGNKTQAEVANALNISPSALAMYEGGHRTPRDEVKILLANYYGETIGKLFFDDEVHVSCTVDPEPT